MGLKILHTADWHLDSPFASFSPEQREYLARQQQKLPQLAAQLCRREGCDLMLLSGDIFDGPYTKDTLELLQQGLREAGVPVFISPGNHDFCGPDSPWLNEVWPENVHIFQGGLEAVDLPWLSCRVYGAGYTSMDCPGMLEGFHAAGRQSYSIAVLHGDPTQLHSPCCPITANQVLESGLNYLALGHIHKAGAFRAGDTLCAWPGCPMGRGWDETGDKGFCIVTIEETAEIRPVPLGLPCFWDITADLEQQPDALEALLPPAPNRDFFRVTLTGRAEPDLDGILAQYAHLPNLVLRDRTEEIIDLWSDVGEDSLRGVYFRMLQEQLYETSPEESHIVQLAAELSRRLLDGREVLLP